MPHIFVVGDSISMHYGPHLAEALGAGFVLARKTGDEAPVRALQGPVRDANGGDSTAVCGWLEAMVASGWCPDLLLLNCGLHDIKTDPVTGAKQVPLDRYRQNLQHIVQLLTSAGIETIWMRTTPVDDATHNANTNRSFFRYAVDVDAYNAVADAVTAAARVTILDLFSFSVSLGLPEAFCDHVHYTESARQRQGVFIAGFVRDYLADHGGRQS